MKRSYRRLCVGWLLSCLVSTSVGFSAQAQPAERVVLRDRSATLKIGSRVVARGDVHRVFRVEQAQEDWRWLVAEDVQGWAKADQIVSIDQAIAFYTDQIQRGGDVAPAYSRRGLLQADRGNDEAALADLTEAIRFGPRSSEAYLNRGIVQRRQGDVEGALRDFNQAVRLNHRDPLVYYNRALASQDAGRIREAIDDFGRTLRLDPMHTAARLNRAALALVADQEGASADAEALLSLTGWEAPNAAYLALIAAMSHERAGRPDRAKTLLSAAKQGLDASEWPYPLLRFLAGEIDQETLLNEARNPTQQAEAGAYAGLSLAHKARAREAVPLLRLAIQHGDPRQIPHLLARTELERLKAAEVPAALEPEEEG